MAKDFGKTKNASLLKEVQKKSMEQTKGLVVKNLPLDQIDENPKNAQIYNMKGIDNLAQGIEEDGYLQTIGVFVKKDGRYEIFTGHRRFRAMKKLQAEGKLDTPTIPSVVFPEPKTEEEKTKKLISTNIRNRPEEPMDMARSIGEMEKILSKEKTEAGRIQYAVAEYFNITSSKAYRYKCLLKLIPELQNLANNRLYSSFERAAQLTKEEQEELYKRLHDYLEDEMVRYQNGKEKEDVEEVSYEELVPDLLSGPRIKQEINALIERRKKEQNAEAGNSEDSDENENEKADENSLDMSKIQDIDAGDDELSDIQVVDSGNAPAANVELPEETIDDSIRVYSTELEKVVDSGEIKIRDKKQVRTYIDKLKKLISILEKYM